MSVWAILAAAGRGERLGLDRPKAFASLNDRPLIAEALERLERSEWIEGIIVAVHHRSDVTPVPEKLVKIRNVLDRDHSFCRPQKLEIPGLAPE